MWRSQSECLASCPSGRCRRAPHHSERRPDAFTAIFHLSFFCHLSSETYKCDLQKIDGVVRWPYRTGGSTGPCQIFHACMVFHWTVDLVLDRCARPASTH
jgi:hypothetical protein